MIGNKVTIVTVTYADRWRLLRQLLQYAEAEPLVREVVVIDNGSVQSIQELATSHSFSKARVSRLERNTGSAAGFRLGLERATGARAELIWLLDDDNLPEVGSLEALVSAHDELTAAGDADKTALLAFRPEHQADVALGVDVDRCYPRRSSFLGFHVLDLPYKIWRRLKPPNADAKTGLADRVLLPFAPYSGLFFHRSLLERIGLPNAELVLYADDTDFTFRVTKAGGSIWLLTGAKLIDLESSWNVKTKFRHSIEQWLRGPGDLRAFYACRNQIHFEHENWTQDANLYRVNKWLYLSLMSFFAWQLDERARMSLLIDAIGRGERAELGLEKRYPLP